MKSRSLALSFIGLIFAACGAIDPADMAADDPAGAAAGETIGQTTEPLVAPSGITALPAFPFHYFPVEISNVNSAKCLDVFRNETADGTKVQQWTCHGGKNQTWFMIHRGGNMYQIRAGHVGNKNLHVAGDNMQDGALLTIENQVADDQIFGVRLQSDGSYEIVSAQSGKCVDVPWWSTDDGKQIQQVACNGSTAQHWHIKKRDSSFNLIAKHSEKCVDVYGASAADGANVQQYPCAKAENQGWYMRDAGISNGTQYWSIVSKGSGKCLDVYKYGTDNGVNVQQWTCHGGDNQKWSVTDNGDGYVTIKNKNSGRCLDVSGVSKTDGANIQQWGCTGRGNQSWFISNYAERHLQVVQVTDDLGAGAVETTYVPLHVDRVNQIFGRYGVRLVYDPATDLNTVSSNTLYNLADDGKPSYDTTSLEIPYGPCPAPGAASLETRMSCARKYAAQWPDKVVVFTRPGGGFSSGFMPFIAIGRMASSADKQCGGAVPDVFWLAHEYGHHVGLAHPFVEADNRAAASAAFQAAGDDVNYFDGDRLSDTAPEPFLSGMGEAEKCIGAVMPTATVTIDGTTGPVPFTISPNNVMDYYYNDVETMTAQQAAITRATSWARGW
jgi:hypothetical protein